MLRPSQAGSWWSTRVADDGIAITMTGSMTGTRFDDSEEKEKETTKREGKERRKRGENAETGEKRGERDNPSEFRRDPNMLPGGVQTVAPRNRSSRRWCCVKAERCVDITARDKTAPDRATANTATTQCSSFTQHHLPLERFI